MSLMAGFDLIIELSRDIVFRLIFNTLRFDGKALRFPFEASREFSAGLSTATIHMVFTFNPSLDYKHIVELNDDDTLTLRLSFCSGTIMLGTPLNRGIGPLSGAVTIRAAVHGGTSGALLTIDMASATAEFDLHAWSATEFSEDLAGSGLSDADFRDTVNDALTQWARLSPNVSIPLPFTVVPGVDGALTPSIQLEAAEIHCIGNTEPDNQALGIFGTLLLANHGQGDHTEKTISEIPRTNGDFAISLSPAAFDQLIFVPSAEGVNPGSEISIDNLSSTFAGNTIRIHGIASRSEICCDARTTFNASFTFNQWRPLTPNLMMEDTFTVIDLHCYFPPCTVGNAVGPMNIAILAFIETTLDNVSISLENLGASIGKLDFVKPSSAYIYGSAITVEGMTMDGGMIINAPWDSGRQSKFKLVGNVVTVDTFEVSSGYFKAQSPCATEVSAYQYTEYQQAQRAVCATVSELTILPLTVEYQLSSGGHLGIPLDTTAGTIAIPNVVTTYAMPLPSGSQVVKTVHINYSISGNQLTLWNNPREGSYTLSIYAVGRDIDGGHAYHQGTSPGPSMHAMETIHFEGDRVDAPEWAADMEQCMQLTPVWWKHLGKKHEIIVLEEDIPSWVPINRATPERLLEMVSKLMLSGIPGIDEVIASIRVAHGSAFTRAMLSDQMRTGFSALAQRRLETNARPARSDAVAALVAAIVELPDDVLAQKLAELRRGE